MGEQRRKSKKKKKQGKKSLLWYILGGGILKEEFIFKHTRMIVLVVVLIFFFIGNRYSCILKLREIDRLQQQLHDVRFEALSISSELTGNSPAVSDRTTRERIRTGIGGGTDTALHIE